MSCELDGPSNVESVSPTLGSYPSLRSNQFLCCSVPEVAGSLCEMCLPAAGFLLGMPLKTSHQFLSFVDEHVLTAHPTVDGRGVFHLPGGSGSLKEDDQAGETLQLLTDFICCSSIGL